MMNALVGSSVKVTGSSTATVSAGPMPGSTPMAVPSVVPTSAQPRWCSATALAKPSLSARRVSSTSHAAFRNSEPALQGASGQRKLEETAEENVGPDCHDRRKQAIPDRVAIVECPRRQPEHRRRGRHEANPFRQHEIDHKG